MTVLFADLSGYTAVAERMDPEAVKALVERCLRRLGEEVERYGGTVDKYIGDNVMALFGAPVAHEDDAERAVRAALGMQAAMEEINDELRARYGVTSRCASGINTGEVLAGAVGDGYTVIGDTVNVAARLQAAARPGSGHGRRAHLRATRDAVEYRQLEPLELKGKAEPVPAWEAVAVLARAAGAPARRPAARRRCRPRRRARAARRSSTSASCARAAPHLVTVVGAGRRGQVAAAARARARARAPASPPPALREGRCLPYGSGVVYWPLGEVMRAECGIVDGDAADVAWAKLSTRLDELLAERRASAAEPAERRAALIGAAARHRARPPDAAPQASARTRSARARASSRRCARWSRRWPRRSPLVLVFEDIHWADEGMLDLIEYLAQWVRGAAADRCAWRATSCSSAAPAGAAAGATRRRSSSTR